MVTPSSSWMFPEDEQIMSDESSIEKSMDGNERVCCQWLELSKWVNPTHVGWLAMG